MSLSSRERKPSAGDGFSCREDVAREFGIPSCRSSSSLKRERSRLTRYRPQLAQQHFGLRLVVSKPVSKLADSCDNLILVIGWTRCLGKFAAAGCVAAAQALCHRAA